MEKYVEICLLVCFESEEKPNPLFIGAKFDSKRKKIYGPLNDIINYTIGLIN